MPERTQDEAIPRRRAYNLRSAFQLLHISDSYGHELVRRGKIRTTRLGPASPRITAEEIDRILRDGISDADSNPKAAASAAPSSADSR